MPQRHPTVRRKYSEFRKFGFTKAGGKITVGNVNNVSTNMLKKDAKKHFKNLQGRPTYLAMAKALGVSPGTLSEWPDRLDGWRLASVEKAIKTERKARREAGRTKKAGGTR